MLRIAETTCEDIWSRCPASQEPRLGGKTASQGGEEGLLVVNLYLYLYLYL